jgi:inner membrane transporter RhtA
MTQAPSSAPSGERGLAVAMVVGGILSVQIGSALVTTIFDDLGPGGAVLLRTTFAAIVLAAIWRPVRVSGVAARDVALFGVVLALMNLCFYEALHRLPLGIAVTFEFMGPLTVAIIGSRSRLDVLWALLAAGGIFMFAPDIGDGLDATGVAFALGAATMWGCYILLSARVGRGPAGLSGLSAAMILAAVILTPIGVHDGGSELFDPAVALTAFGVAMLASAVPYVLELEALRRLPPKTVGVLLSLEPAAAAAIGAVALSQDLAGRELVAIAMVVIASAGALSSADAPEAAQV